MAVRLPAVSRFRESRLPLALVWIFLASLWIAGTGTSGADAAEPFSLSLRWQRKAEWLSGEQFVAFERIESWKPDETAIIVCDVWDYHHCRNAVRRLEEFAPRLDAVLRKAREAGATIIHAPSDCMPAYADHPARKRAMEVPLTGHVPYGIADWCSKLPAEEGRLYPIDQSDGGEDDDPTEHAAWRKTLTELGRDPNLPWKRQSDLITINSTKDFLSDRGGEIWNVLESRGIRNVILTGVHVNMCVLGRPFGLRQMARAGKNVVLMRDMTDAMYNPARWPYVSHFTGNDRVIEHIERFVCPTVTSDQILGGEPFRFSKDTRPHVVIAIAEEGYDTAETLPRFAGESLGQDFRVTILQADPAVPGSIPGLAALKTADLLLLSVRRRPLPAADMAILRDFVRRGKPVVGIRTASHAFSLPDGKTPADGLEVWSTFDADVFGGHYHGGYPQETEATLSVPPQMERRMRKGMDDDSDSSAAVLGHFLEGPFLVRHPHLYKTGPLEAGATVLLEGTVAGNAPEPVAWTFRRADGGRSFYVSLGWRHEFADRSFRALLRDAVYWAIGRPITDPPYAGGEGRSAWYDFTSPPDRWVNVTSPLRNDEASLKRFEFADTPQWYRCVLRIPDDWIGTKPLPLEVGAAVDEGAVRGYINGQELKSIGSWNLGIPPEAVSPNDHNLLVLEFKDAPYAREISPVVRSSSDARSPAGELDLAGQWQLRSGRNGGSGPVRLPPGPPDDFRTMPLPAKFGGGSDIVFSPEEPLWTARPITRPHEFTPGIEGPACDRHGDVYAVNFDRQGTIGLITPQGRSEIFVQLPKGSTGNGLRFGSQGELYVADYTGHNILRVDSETKTVTVHAHNPAMSQPNDIAIASDGTLYASDPDWAASTGRVWRIDRDGTTTLLAKGLGTTNGIEVSPDGKTLYVNESVQRNIWAFPIQADKTLGEKRLVRRFEDHGFDGMRADADGNLFVTRHGKGTVVHMTPDGKILREIGVLGRYPSNLTLGDNGRMVYVTEVEFGRIVGFRVK